MNPSSKLHEILAPITTRLKLIEEGDGPQSKEYAEVDVKSVIDNGITGIDPETLLHALEVYNERVQDLIARIEVIYPKSLFKADKLPGKSFVDKPTIIKSAKTKFTKTIASLKEELNVYAKFFKAQLDQAEQLYSELGSDKFANAGFRLNFNLTAKELVILIDVMIGTGFIQKTTGEKLTNKKVYEFVIKNFNTEKGIPVTMDTLANAKSKYMGKETDSLQQKIEMLLDKVKGY